MALDLSTAVDCINITTLVRHLEYSFGLSGTVLQWITSYFSHRQQFVWVGELQVKHGYMHLWCSTRQCSWTSTVLSVHSPIASIIAHYAQTTPNCTDSALQTCFSLLCTWFTTNGLSLNAEKSEAIIFSSTQNSTSICQHTDVNLTSSKIVVSTKIKNPGVILDSSLTFANHRSNVCQKSNFHIKGSLPHQ